MLSLSLPVAALVTTLVSLGVAQALVMSAHRHGHLTMDLPGAVQEFHQSPTPRVGGIGIYIALAIAWSAPARVSAGCSRPCSWAGCPPCASACWKT